MLLPFDEYTPKPFSTSNSAPKPTPTPATTDAAANNALVAAQIAATLDNPNGKRPLHDDEEDDKDAEGSSTGGGGGGDDAQPKSAKKEGKRIKRPRPVMSCTMCVKRKTKCDKTVPCAACIRRGNSEGCQVEAPSETTA